MKAKTVPFGTAVRAYGRQALNRELLRGVGQQFVRSFRVLRHPHEVYGEIRYLGRASLGAAVLHVILAFAAMLLAEYLTSYIFNPVPKQFINPLMTLLQLLLPFLSWCCAHYLVGSITHGQARFSDVFVGSSYALIPITVFSVPIALLSNAFTLTEASIYRFCEMAMFGWTIFLFFVFVKEVQNYELGETVRNMVFSVLLMFASWILIFIFAGLTFQFVDFIEQVYREVAFRE